MLFDFWSMFRSAPRYPIFHDQLSHRLGDQSDWTLASVLFDLKEAVGLVAAVRKSEHHINKLNIKSMGPVAQLGTRTSSFWVVLNSCLDFFSDWFGLLSLLCHWKTFGTRSCQHGPVQ